MKIHFPDHEETFVLENPENISGLYFPMASEKGLRSAITPGLNGDIKMNQNAFLMEPVSIENLHNNRSSRNLWCLIEEDPKKASGKSGIWSAAGASASQEAARFGENQEESTLTCGFMTHHIERKCKEFPVTSEISTFVPMKDNTEITQLTLKNTGTESLYITVIAAFPIFGRSADNLRDHRHVTSLLNRIRTTAYGVLVKPTLSFDERGHVENRTIYYACGKTGEGGRPEGFYPTAEGFLGEGGSFLHPGALYGQGTACEAEGTHIDGKEALGGIRFGKTEIAPGGEAVWDIYFGVTEQEEDIQRILREYGTAQSVAEAMERNRREWRRKVNIRFQSGKPEADAFMRWVAFQPYLRKIYGCSFLPHHDYGRGGRGWRDLWQDCLALLLMDSTGIREGLLNNFCGIRIDGTNATIIGNRPGEFVADRNGIARIWMDHAFWPLLTMKFYIDATGDLTVLNEQEGYFCDSLTERGRVVRPVSKENNDNLLKGADGSPYRGSLYEHLLIENLCACYDTGAHGFIRLHNADWNDALDMAPDKGESVAFTCGYAGNLLTLAELAEKLGESNGIGMIEIATEVLALLPEKGSALKNDTGRLERYLKKCGKGVAGTKEEISAVRLSSLLREKSRTMMEKIREEEWVADGGEHHWFNGYYDNHGERVEGVCRGQVRMMLISQVFEIMSGTANDDQIKEIIRSVDTYLNDPSNGACRLNTDFKELKTDLGRMFGFAYGEKENGAVFSHMAVMYAYALLKRGFAKEGYRVLKSLVSVSQDFDKSRIYPGIPEYFDAQGRGKYHYLTGAASWFLMAAVTQLFGIRGEYGALCISPKIPKELFDENGNAEISLPFGGKTFDIIFINQGIADEEHENIRSAKLDGLEAVKRKEKVLICRETIEALDGAVHEIEVVLD